jgi:hypothetical protein
MGALDWREGSSRISLPSGTDFTSSGTTFQPVFKIVKISSGKVVASAAATDKHIGVLMNCPALNDTADVLAINNMGTGKVLAGGTVNVGDYLTSDGSGQAIATTTSGNIIIGQALTGGASGQLVEYLSFREVI